MKKILLTLILSAVLVIANAQTEKGDWMVGGSFRLNTSENNTEDQSYTRMQLLLLSIILLLVEMSV